MNGENEPGKILDNFAIRPDSLPVELPVHEAQQLSGLFNRYQHFINSERYGDRNVVITPDVSFKRGKDNVSAYFFKDKIDARRSDASITGVIDVKTGKKQSVLEQYRFTIDPTSGIISQVNSELEAPAFNDNQLLRMAIEQTRTEFDKRQSSKLERKHRHRRKIAGFMGTWVLAVGAIEGYQQYNDYQASNARKDAAKRATYDQNHTNLDGIAVEITRLEVGDLPRAQFDEIPTYKSGDSLLSPRRFVLESKKCKTFDTKVKLGEKILLATSDQDVIQHKNVTAGIDDKSDLLICSSTKYPDKHTHWTLAVQLEK